MTVASPVADRPAALLEESPTHRVAAVHLHPRQHLGHSACADDFTVNAVAIKPIRLVPCQLHVVLVMD
jgi:hypothetical protein